MMTPSRSYTRPAGPGAQCPPGTRRWRQAPPARAAARIRTAAAGGGRRLRPPRRLPYRAPLPQHRAPLPELPPWHTTGPDAAPQPRGPGHAGQVRLVVARALADGPGGRPDQATPSARNAAAVPAAATMTPRNGARTRNALTAPLS